LAGLLLVLMLAGLVYSIFPFLILDSLTVWDAASSLSSLGLVMASALVALPVLLIFNVLGYWRLFVRRTISPVSPSAVQE
jgi:cytochrome d ubiquinol oxidase subunit II